MPIKNAGNSRAGFDQHQFGRPAADVKNHCRAFPAFEQDMAAENGQSGFFFGSDDIEVNAGLLPHPLDELIAIGGAAAGFGSDRASEVDIALP